jgi:pimeloyl-ACP methyl ester carboxylesterase
MLTNYQLLGGLDSSYSAGVVEAMRDAGLSGERVMLVGHSQGGMVAADIASDPALATEFGIGHVVTAGSPTAQVAELPDGTVALHLENRGDVVPLLDGQDNPAGADRVTVRFDAGDHDLGARRHGTGADHGLDRYVLGASAVDACEHGSVRDLLRRMREAGFLVEGARVEEVLTYSIVRPG